MTDVAKPFIEMAGSNRPPAIGSIGVGPVWTGTNMFNVANRVDDVSLRLATVESAIAELEDLLKQWGLAR